jgi:hypothetical protein
MVMNEIPTGTELARPFLPTKDFELSKRFYEALGFEKVLDGDVAILAPGPEGSFCSAAIRKTGPAIS